MLGVGDSHAATDPRAAKVLPLHDRLDDPLEIAGADLAGIDERSGHLPDHALLGGGIEARADGFRRDEIGEFHARRCPASVRLGGKIMGRRDRRKGVS